jgi:hypothetical protein
MHLAFLKALVAVISAAVIAVGVALAPGGTAHHANGSPATSQASKLQTDGEFSARRSLAQIAASRGVPTSTPTTVLLRHIRDDLDRAERDQAVSPAAASSLLDALRTALGDS